MNRRIIFLAVAFVAVFVGGLIAISVLNLGSGKTLKADGFAQVKNGMTLREVETLLGGPAGNYGRNSGGTSEMTLEEMMTSPDARELIWCDDSKRFEIYFDAQDRVVAFHRRAGYSQRPGPSWWDQLRMKMGW